MTTANAIGLARDRVELYWLPLGAGDNTRCVRTNGRIFEALAARCRHRERCDLYHAALMVQFDGDRFAIEMAPVWSTDTPDRGVVCEGPVGLRPLGRSWFFRYEVRCWRGGAIPDIAEAVDSPELVSSNRTQAEQILALAPAFPPATWGRDELNAGDMWNSNSLVAWLLSRSGHDMRAIRPPARGRAPGWHAGRSQIKFAGPPWAMRSDGSAATDERRRRRFRAAPAQTLENSGEWGAFGPQIHNCF